MSDSLLSKLVKTGIQMGIFYRVIQHWKCTPKAQIQAVQHSLDGHHIQKMRKIKKTILLISLSKKGKNKAKGKLDYKAVTRVVASLMPSQCNVPAVTQLVSQQVGFVVQLLDSKC